jgi:hypothetical protein
MPALKPDYQRGQLKHAAESSCLSHEDELNGGPKTQQLETTKKGCLSALFTFPRWKDRRSGGGGGGRGTTVAVLDRLDSAASATTATTRTTPPAREQAASGGGKAMSRGRDSRKGTKSVRIIEASLPTAITLSSSKSSKVKNKKGGHLSLHHEEAESSTSSSGSYHETRLALLRGAFVEGLIDDNILDRVEFGTMDSGGEPVHGEDEENNNNQWFGEVRMIPLGDLDDALLDSIDFWSQAEVQGVTEEKPSLAATSPSTQRGGGKVNLRHSRSDCSASSNLSASSHSRLRNFLANKSPVKRQSLSVGEEKDEGLVV